MATRLFGIETEYAITALDSKGDDPGRGNEIVYRLLEEAKRRLVHLPDMHGHGMFLENGSRLYVDCGHHPELSTPECADPWDAVRYVLAGDQILAGLAAQLEAKHHGTQTLLHKCNVDYSGTGSTWGSHESYLHRANRAALPKQVIPHLVSRLIYTGAGGFDSRSPGLEFMLSPRVAHLVQTVSHESTTDRGIFHTKDETLAGPGYHRLHLLCGESLCSERAIWLKVGTTALVVALIEADLRPGDAVELRHPLMAMQCFAGDPTCKATATSVKGEELPAITIQRHYLELAEKHRDAPWMPPWAKEVCKGWRAILDQLEQAPVSVSTVLDWGIKLSLYSNHCCSRRVEWKSLPDWTYVLRRFQEALARTTGGVQQVRVEHLLSKDSPVADEVKALTPFIRQHGLTWDGLRPFVDLRRELFEIDTRFGQVGGRGIFGSLDQAGVLTHRMTKANRIEQAMTNPPSGGRAQIRGQTVRQLASDKGQYLCDWTGVWEPAGRQLLDLGDPFSNEARWKRSAKKKEAGAPSPPGSESPSSVRPRQALSAMRERVLNTLRSSIRRRRA